MPKTSSRLTTRHVIRRFVLPLFLSLVALSPFLLHAQKKLQFDLLNTIDNSIYDLKINVMRADVIDPRVVIVDIDDGSLQAEGQWPWPRDKLARLVSNLFNEYGVRAVGFDVVFAEPDRVTAAVQETLGEVLTAPGLDPPSRELLTAVRSRHDHDTEFASALTGGATVLGFIFSQQSGGDIGSLPASVKVRKLAPLAGYPHQALGYLANLPVLQQAAVDAGYFDNPMVDQDGVFRRLPLLQYFEGGLYQALGLALLRAAEGLPLPELGTWDEGEDADVDFLKLGDHFIPVDDNLAALVPYRGRQGSFPYVSAVDVLRGNAPIDVLFDRIVLVGTTAPGLFDMRSTPVANVYAGVEVHANVISGILDGSFWQQPDWAPLYETLIVASAGLLLALTLPHLPPLIGAGLVLLLIGLGILANFVIAYGGLIVLPLASYVVSTFFAAVLLIGLNVVTERRKKRYLSRVFSKYVPRELVAQFEKSEAEVSLEGESREMSVLFSDIRDFTSISEGLAPTELTEMMNAYLTPVTRVIQTHHGNVDKYIGDAVMAFWGAPQYNPAHARDALNAAMDMQAALADMLPAFRERGWPELRMGIGLNTGVVNVGNMGSAYRTAYTVMGDAVNLASRLEGLSKYYGVQIVIGESVAKAVEGFILRELDRVRVKGKEAPVTIYEPLARQAELAPGQEVELAAYASALACYRRQQWRDANHAFAGLCEQHPGRQLYRIYASRCEQYLSQPPAGNWDGVFQMQQK